MARNVFAPLFWDVRRMAVCVALEGRCAGFTGPNMPSAIAALANLNVGTAYFDGELCGVDDAGLPSFAALGLQPIDDGA